MYANFYQSKVHLSFRSSEANVKFPLMESSFNFHGSLLETLDSNRSINWFVPENISEIFSNKIPQLIEVKEEESGE